MTGDDDTFICATCDMVIDHHPVFHLGLAFCCAGCAADGPCMCSYDVDEARPAAAAPARVDETASLDAVPPMVEPPLPAAPPVRPAVAPTAEPARRTPVEVERKVPVGAGRR